MKTVIIYTTKYGTSEKIVRKIKKELKAGTDLINIRENHSPDISPYDRVIIGGSIYAGSVSPVLKKFIKRNIEALYDKKIALFLVCLSEGEVARKQFEDNFPEILRKKSVVNGLFGGELVISKLNKVEKFIMWVVKKRKEDVYNINEKEIERFTSVLNKK